MTELAQSLLKCRIEGNTLFLPPISDGMLPNYSEVRAALLKAGAKYKKNTFVFSSDAQPFIDRLTGGESVNIQKEFQFFPTPAELADELVILADLQAKDDILEPSAGQGAIVEAIKRGGTPVTILCVELMPENAAVLRKKGLSVIECDFMEFKMSHAVFNKVIANPPFSKNQDIEHIRRMYDHVKPGGRIVTICSNHWTFAKGKKEQEFRDWLNTLDHEIKPIKAGEFKESGTMVGANILIIDK